MIYGYARVSTKGQGRDGNSLTDQHKRLVEQGVPEENVYTDQFTGTKLDRPQFTKLMNQLKTGDTLVVCKLDRFARNAADGAKTIQGLLNKGVRVNILNMGVADNTPMGKLMITIMLAFAEFERDMIVQRTTTGKAVARSTNPEYRQGRPKKAKVSPEELLQIREGIQQKRTTYAESAARLCISQRTLRRYLSHDP